MTLAEMKQQIRAVGMTVRQAYSTDEYRINFPYGDEATAYYTNDRTDAVLTAQHMASNKKEG
jgi:hypothetical protein